MTKDNFGLTIQQHRDICESLHVPEDGNLDVVCIMGSWYIKTEAGNLQTAREIRTTIIEERQP